MVEVIYLFKQGKYPFGRGKTLEHTYMEYVLEAKDQKQLDKYRELASIIKKINHPNIIRLERVLKQQLKFHILYEFQNTSLEQRLKQFDKVQELTSYFVELQKVFDALIERKLKAQLYLEFMGVDETNRLKVWMKPDQLQYVGNMDSEQNKIKKDLEDFYQIERTRIHLQIEELIETSFIDKQKNVTKNKQSRLDNLPLKGLSKVKSPNFKIEGNALVFLNQQTQKQKTDKKKHHPSDPKEKHFMSKANHLVYQQAPLVKIENPAITNKISNPIQQAPDVSKKTVAQKVLYYKKLKLNQIRLSQKSQETKLIVKDSSTSDLSLNDLSNSSNNDSNIKIKTEIVGKNKMKIIASQQVQVEGNSDDDLEKLAMQKIANFKNQATQYHDSSTENNSRGSSRAEKSTKELNQSSREENQEKSEEHSKEITYKINQAKQKAKNILSKYSQTLKK